MPNFQCSNSSVPSRKPTNLLLGNDFSNKTFRRRSHQENSSLSGIFDSILKDDFLFKKEKEKFTFKNLS
jgi:hypothetical protein